MRRFFAQSAFRSLLVVSSICAALPLFGAGVVTNATQAALQSAMAGGGTVNLAFNGTIGLESTITVATNTMLIASNQSVTISGNKTVQLFICSTIGDLRFEQSCFGRWSCFRVWRVDLQYRDGSGYRLPLHEQRC
ncbi:MAG: hypothetical protein ACLQVY_13245 [Limisphaerales bacterium]